MVLLMIILPEILDIQKFSIIRKWIINRQLDWLNGYDEQEADIRELMIIKDHNSARVLHDTSLETGPGRDHIAANHS